MSSVARYFSPRVAFFGSAAAGRLDPAARRSVLRLILSLCAIAASVVATEAATITVIVTGADGRPVQNADVWVYNYDESIYTTEKTDAQGRAVFRYMPAGHTEISAQPYGSATGDFIVVRTEDDVSHEYDLTKHPAMPEGAGAYIDALRKRAETDRGWGDEEAFQESVEELERFLRAEADAEKAISATTSILRTRTIGGVPEPFRERLETGLEQAKSLEDQVRVVEQSVNEMRRALSRGSSAGLPVAPSIRTAIPNLDLLLRRYKLLLQHRQNREAAERALDALKEPSSGGTQQQGTPSPQPQQQQQQQQEVATPSAPDDCAAFGSGYAYDPAAGACLRTGLSFDLVLGTSYSIVGLDSAFGSGTVVGGGEERFAAKTPDSVDRFGFDFETKIFLGATSPGAGRPYLSFYVSHAGGTETSSAKSVVGSDGVTGIGVTYLEPAGATGLFASTPDYSIAGTARIENAWTLVGVGYNQSFRPGGPDAMRLSISVGPSFECFAQDFAAWSEIRDTAQTTLVTQKTEASFHDRYFGVRLGAGVSYPITPHLSAGFNGYLTPAYRVSRGDLSQFTDFTTDVAQDFDFSNNGLSLSGGVGAHVSFEVNERLHLKASYEYSRLGGVTQAHVPQNPNEQPVRFGSGSIDRNFVKLDARIRF